MHLCTVCVVLAFSRCNLLTSLVHFSLYFCEGFCSHPFVSAETPQPAGHACTVALLPTWSWPHGPFPLPPSAIIPTQTNSCTRNWLRCRFTVFSCWNASALNGWSTPYAYWATPTSTSSSRKHTVIFYKHRDGILALRCASFPPVCAAKE